MKIEINIDTAPEWWYKFVLSCDDEREFVNSLKKHGIVMEEFGSNKYSMVFDSEENYVMFMLTWS